MFIHSRSSLENHTRFQTKMAKVYTYTRFQTKTGQEPYPMGRHIPNPPPPPDSRHSITENIGLGKTISDQFLGYKISTRVLFPVFSHA